MKRWVSESSGSVGQAMRTASLRRDAGHRANVCAAARCAMTRPARSGSKSWRIEKRRWVRSAPALAHGAAALHVRRRRRNRASRTRVPHLTPLPTAQRVPVDGLRSHSSSANHLQIPVLIEICSRAWLNSNRGSQRPSLPVSPCDPSATPPPPPALQSSVR